jgi:glycosyltransferase involved in cell wall biosynthesis
MRVLLISYYFPPYNTIGAVRTGKTAKYLRELGHDVRVLTVADHPGLEPTLPVEIPSAQVLRIRWPSADRLVGRLLARRRAAVSSGEVSVQHAGSRLVSRIGHLYRTLLCFPDETAVGLAHAYAAAARLLRSWRADVLFASAAPYSSLLLAAALGRRFGIPWVGELRDLWVENQAYRYSPARRRVEAALERRVLRSAAALVSVSEPLAERLRRVHRRPTAVVLNGFDRGDYPPDARPDPALPLRVVYTGQVFPEKQDPTLLVDALHRLGDARRDVRLVFYGRFLGLALEGTMRRAAELGVSDCLAIRRPVSYGEALRIQREADVLLLLTWSDPANPGVYTGKLFEYVGAGRPILAVGRIPTIADDLIGERRLGVSLRDPDAIAEQLRVWIAAKGSGGGVPAVDEALAAGLTRREQTRTLAEFLERVVPTARHHARDGAVRADETLSVPHG